MIVTNVPLPFPVLGSPGFSSVVVPEVVGASVVVVEVVVASVVVVVVVSSFGFTIVLVTE